MDGMAFYKRSLITRADKLSRKQSKALTSLFSHIVGLPPSGNAHKSMLIQDIVCMCNWKCNVRASGTWLFQHTHSIQMLTVYHMETYKKKAEENGQPYMSWRYHWYNKKENIRDVGT